MILATKNRGKIRELKALLEELVVDVGSLLDYPEMPDVLEDGSSFFENALKKARAVSEYTGAPVVADDSGLVVECLGGRPGIHSARYAGPRASDEDNYRKLLEEMRGVPESQRAAAFRCSLVLYHPDGTYRSFEGMLEGFIARQPRGTQGFGYDPVFIVPEYGKTVAELPSEVKNRISHRARAFQELKKALKKEARIH